MAIERQLIWNHLNPSQEDTPGGIIKTPQGESELIESRSGGENRDRKIYYSLGENTIKYHNGGVTSEAWQSKRYPQISSLEITIS